MLKILFGERRFTFQNQMYSDSFQYCPYISKTNKSFNKLKKLILNAFAREMQVHNDGLVGQRNSRGYKAQHENKYMAGWVI